MMYWQSVLLIVIVGLYYSPISGQNFWCTRTKSELMQQQVTQIEKCNKTYQDSCGGFYLFSSEQCTFYEMVDCPVKKNITITRYFLVEECCPGFKLDPINNITCIEKDEKDYLKELSTIGSNGEKGATIKEGEMGNLAVEEDDGLLFGLSYGACAGIICILLFVLCVVILIAMHFRKRSRKEKAKHKSSMGMEMDTTEKMITVPA